MFDEQWNPDGEKRNHLFVDKAVVLGLFLVAAWTTVAWLASGDDWDLPAGNYPVCVNLETGEVDYIQTEAVLRLKELHEP